MLSIWNRTWPVFGLTLLLLFVFGPALAAGALLATGDALGYYLPARAIAAAAYLHGELPFWNPFNFSGIPLLAAFQGGALYPGNLPFLFLTPQPAMNVTVLGAYFVAGLTTYFYARALTMPRLAAWLSAACFMLSGYMVAHLEHLTMLQGAAWLPAMLWAIERQIATGRWRYAGLMALAVALQVLAGYPQTVIISLLWVGPYAAWRVWQVSRAEVEDEGVASSISPWRQLGAFALAVGLGLGLAAIQVLPASHMLAASARGGIGYEELVATSLPPRQLITLLFPFLFGAVPSGLFPTPYWGSGTWPNELTGYAGLVPLMLAVGALLNWRSFGAVRFWALSGGMSLLLALGGATPLYRLWGMLPVLKMVRVPGRHLMVFDLAIAILAGYGLWALMQGQWRKRLSAETMVLGFTFVGAFGIAVFGPGLAARWQPLMPQWTVLSTVLSASSPAVYVPLVLAILGFLAIRTMRRHPTPFAQAFVVGLALADLLFFGQFQGSLLQIPLRCDPLVTPVKPVGARSLSISATGYPFHDLKLMQALGSPQLGAFWGVRSVNGYEPMLGAHYSHLVGDVTLSGVIQDPGLFAEQQHALDILACAEVRLEPGLSQRLDWQARLRPPRWQPDGPNRFVNARAMPLLWRAEKVVILPTARLDAAIRGEGAPWMGAGVAMVESADVPQDLMHKDLSSPSPGLRPPSPHGSGEPALLSSGGLARQKPPSPSAGVRLDWEATPGTIALLERGFGGLVYRTEGRGPGLTVISEGYDAGWHAALADGRELPVYRVDGLILGVAVPPGLQTVHLRYVPPGWSEGLWSSAISLLLLVGWMGLSLMRRVA